ncbi:MAG: hypothetical protein MO853_05420 [Candidatus Protistobacter heckmanni]|nr:hypothetical protein [Candidatus Protistobacter heckmanni]
MAVEARQRLDHAPQLLARAVVGPRAAAETQHVGVVGNSGASCVLAADASAALDALLPPFSLSRNPIDLTAMLLSDPSLVGKVMQAVLADPGADAAMLSLTAEAGPGYNVPRFAAETAEAMARANKPVAAVSPDHRVRQRFTERGMAAYTSETEALCALRESSRHLKQLT